MTDTASVPPSHPLGVGQRDNSAIIGREISAASKPCSLKALARLVLASVKVEKATNDSGQPPRPSVPSNRMPSGQAMPVEKHGIAAGSTIIERDAGVPRAWAEGFTRLRNMPCPAGVPPHRWQRFIGDAGQFLNHGRAAQAASLGWEPADLFGCDRHRPWERIDAQGLLWLLDGREVAALTATAASIRAPCGAVTTYRRMPSRTGVRTLAWELTLVRPSD